MRKPIASIATSANVVPRCRRARRIQHQRRAGADRERHSARCSETPPLRRAM